MKTEPVVVEKLINATAERVWQAITDNDQMKQWYFDIKEFKPEVGFEFHFYGDKDKYPTTAKVVKVEPNKTLAYTWNLDENPGISTVTWQLFAQDGKTLVRITHEGLENIQGNGDRNFEKSSFVQGWTHFIGKLYDFVETK